MRLIVFLILLLCACSTPTVRCDAQLKPINPPAPGAAAAVGGAVTEPSVGSGPAGEAPPSRRAP
jgi:hypothetical protein